MSIWTRNILLSIALMGSAVSQAAIINFDEDGAGNALAAGTFVGDQWKDSLGVEFSAVTGRTDTNGQPLELMIFDSLNPTGGDGDLSTRQGPGEKRGTDNNTELGNILIISEDNDQSDPDDLAPGGTVRVTFAAPTLVQSLGILDIEQDKYFRIKLFDAVGAELFNSKFFGVAPNSANGVKDNGYQETLLNIAGVARMDVMFNTSAAITHLEFGSQSVPEPGTLALLMAGLLGLRYSRKRLA